MWNSVGEHFELAPGAGGGVGELVRPVGIYPGVRLVVLPHVDTRASLTYENLQSPSIVLPPVETFIGG